MNESMFHNSKLQNQLLKVSVKFKIRSLQFTNMRLLVTANKLIGSNTYFDVVIGNIFSQIDSLREAWFVNMFSSYMVNVNEENVKDMLFFGEKQWKGE